MGFGAYVAGTYSLSVVAHFKHVTYTKTHTLTCTHAYKGV